MLFVCKACQYTGIPANYESITYNIRRFLVMQVGTRMHFCDSLNTIALTTKVNYSAPVLRNFSFMPFSIKQNSNNKHHFEKFLSYASIDKTENVMNATHLETDF